MAIEVPESYSGIKPVLYYPKRGEFFRRQVKGRFYYKWTFFGSGIHLAFFPTIRQQLRFLPLEGFDKNTILRDQISHKPG